jgi:DNA-binding NtrC family response regulator
LVPGREGGQNVLAYRILIADDEFLIRWSLTQALSQEGYEVIAVENGREAIETGQSAHFDFVITDLFMPEIDGWGVLNFFRQTQPPSRVIVVTAHGEDDTERVAKERGAWAYVKKPYIIDRVKEILRTPNDEWFV